MQALHQHFIAHCNCRRQQRRRGVAIVYFALGIFVFIGAAALSVDIAILYQKKAAAQQAADAAALAGAYQFATFQATAGVPTYAHSMAHYYAQLNGYRDDLGQATVTSTYPVPGKGSNNFQVRVTRAEPLFFAQIFKLRTVNVGATAVALYTTLAPMSINGGGQYGATNGPVNLSIYGPNAYYNNGDAYSPRYLPSGATNPLFQQAPDGYGVGYDFTVNIPVGFGNVSFEIYDPDCYNAGNSSGGNPYVSAGVSIDELRTGPTGGGGGANGGTRATTTRYNLYYDNNTPFNPNDDVLVGSQSYGDTSTTDMKWNSVFNFSRSSYGAGNFRLNATTTAGSGENGFSLRVNKQGQTFSSTNGTSISAQGHLPMNFNNGGTVGIVLGDVPTEAAGGQLEIAKFDTDVGSLSVVYTCTSLPGQTFNGVLSSDGTWKTDFITLPANYTQGTWTATYTAGANDTSVWEMSYSNSGPGRPGRIKLVQ